eukprot:472436_1
MEFTTFVKLTKQRSRLHRTKSKSFRRIFRFGASRKWFSHVNKSTSIYPGTQKPKRAKSFLGGDLRTRVYGEKRISHFGTSAPTSPSIPAGTSLSVLFGSQTGTARSFAQQLARDARKHGFAADYAPIDTLNARTVEQCVSDGRVLVLMASCFGQGEPPDNAKRGFEWIMDSAREAESTKFRSLKYCVFGLGQSVLYPERYQAVGRALDSRLAKLGAQKIMPIGEGDDGHDIEADFENWEDTFFEILSDSASKTSDSTSKFGPSDLRSKPVQSIPARTEIVADELTGSDSRPYDAPVTAHVQLHARHDKRVPASYHLELDVADYQRPTEISNSGGSAKYNTGDYVGVLPRNEAHTVELYASRLGLDLHERVVPADKPEVSTDIAADGSMSLHEALTKCLNITTPPRRATVSELASFARDPIEAGKLKYLGSGTELSKIDYRSWVLKEHRSLIDILSAFRSISMSASELCDLLPPVVPQFYSISSSAVLYPNLVHLSVTHAEFDNKFTGRSGFGLCSGFLAECKVGDKVPLFIKESLMRLPEDPSVPITMVCAGSGIAPMRAFIQERVHVQSALKMRGCAELNTLFFGYSWADSKDFLRYRDEFQSSVDNEMLTVHHALAFEKPWYTFVQHRMLELPLSAQLWDSLSARSGHIYVCGEAGGLGAG